MGYNRQKIKENTFFLHFFAKIFGHIKKKQYLCTRFREGSSVLTKNAAIAQLVEHNLAKVGVAGSSPVFRSNFFVRLDLKIDARPGGGIGRHATLRG